MRSVSRGLPNEPLKRFFDTSVLVSAFVEDERCHDACAEAVASTTDGVVCVHALAECFSILTGGRLPSRLSAADAAEMIEANICDRMKVIALTARETMQLLRSCDQLGVRGGGIYDCLHLATARKAGAGEILTLNARHFRSFAPDLVSRIREPGAG